MRHRLLLVVALGACGRLRFDPESSPADARGDGDVDAMVPLSCGDGVVDVGEECDTAGASLGCTASCQLADQGAGGTCPSPATLTLVPTATGMGASATGDTSTSTNTAQVSCTPANSLDRAYTVVIPSATTLSITLTPTTGWNPALAVRDAALACNQSTTLCCVDAAGAGIAETSACPVPAGSVMIVVDASSGGQSGPFALRVSMP